LQQAHASVARRPQRESDDLALVLRARNGDGRSLAWAASEVTIPRI